MLTVDLRKLALSPGDTCLDLGCGEGRHALAAYLLEGVQSLGIDLSEQDLGVATKRIDDMQSHAPCGQIAFAAGDATCLPLPDASVDAAIASEVLEHIPNYLTVLEELWRVLKPGGRLCISVPRQWPEWVCWRLSEGYRTTPGGHIRIFDATHLRRELMRQGFTLTDRESAHALHVPYWWLKCIFWRRDDEPWPVRIYHQALVWDLMKRPRVTRVIEALLNPIMGKSIVLYFIKPDVRQTMVVEACQ